MIVARRGGAVDRRAGTRADRLSPERGESGRARVVPGRALRPVRALGRLQRARRRRVGDEQPQDPRRRLREAAGPVQSGGVRSGRVGRARESGGHEVHHHHEQASRRLRDVRLQGSPTTTSSRARRIGRMSSRRSPRSAGSRASSCSSTIHSSTGIIPTTFRAAAPAATRSGRSRASGRATSST